MTLEQLWGLCCMFVANSDSDSSQCGWPGVGSCPSCTGMWFDIRDHIDSINIIYNTAHSISSSPYCTQNSRNFWHWQEKELIEFSLSKGYIIIGEELCIELNTQPNTQTFQKAIRPRPRLGNSLYYNILGLALFVKILCDIFIIEYAE